MYYTEELPPMTDVFTPRNWILLAYEGEYAILSGTSYDWRRSSQIVEVENHEGAYLVTTKSGSRYRLLLENFGLSVMSAGVLDRITSHPQAKVFGVLLQDRAKRILDVGFR